MEGKSSRIDSERATPAIVPRAYQLEILRIARARNTLAFLPTASGKTLIAILLIQVRLEIIRSEIGRGGSKKLIAFLAPTRVLVNQQKDSIQQHCRDFVVRDYTGDSSRQGKKIENLGLSEWKKECQETDIMVFTPQILRQVLEHGFVPVSLFDLIVLDECHHAFGKDSMAVVCELVKRSPVKPLLLGLTGSPVPCKKVTAKR
jgi:endoribonuclease Dicer